MICNVSIALHKFKRLKIQVSTYLKRDDELSADD